jgi:hypothetical protein
VDGGHSMMMALDDEEKEHPPSQFPILTNSNRCAEGKQALEERAGQ